MAHRPAVVLRPAPLPAPLEAADLRWRCPAQSLPCASTRDVRPVQGVIGQDTAVSALRFGMAIDAPGQNIFVRGLAGTGRMTLIRNLLEDTRPECAQARDRCYVHDFRQPDRPRLITLPWGRAHALRRRIDELADFIRDDLEGALNTAGIEAHRAAVEAETQQRIEAVVKPFDATARAAGLTLVTVQVGPAAQAVLLPLIDDKPVPPERWQQLRAEGRISEAEHGRVQQQMQDLQDRLQALITEINRIRHRHAEAVHELRVAAVRAILGGLAQRIAAEFTDPNVRVFLDELIEDVAHHGDGDEPRHGGPQRHRVNAILAHDGTPHCPIVVENVPTVTNLLGTAERRFEPHGPSTSDHHMISAGSLLRADGGYLILEARDVLSEPGAWKVLIRTLRTGRLEIVPPELRGPWFGMSLKPEAIDINVKVILLGDADIYHLLDTFDDDFVQLFKVLADFDSTIPRNDENMAGYAAVLASLVEKERLPHFERGAIAGLIEHGVRIASRQDRLTSRFGRLADIAREAAFISRRRGADAVEADDVTHAIQASKFRANLPSRRFRELLADGTIRVSTSGRTVGQINGLAVSQAGPLTSGFPARITATIGPGSAGVINIEREAQLSGAIHTKGFYILGGLLRHLLHTVHPLAFNASIAFEQSYGGIDGDSASAAEICCLLSALTDVPIRQDLAVTGAIDQHGNILAIGAVNEKIEGFYDTCLDAGLTGTQGVIIPQANARDLMLRPDVVEACAAGRFAVYAVGRVSDALELLTGVLCGEADESGEYPPDTLLGVALERAFEFWLKMSPTLVPVSEEEYAQQRAESGRGKGRAPRPKPRSTKPSPPGNRPVMKRGGKPINKKNRKGGARRRG